MVIVRVYTITSTPYECSNNMLNVVYWWQQSDDTTHLVLWCGFWWVWLWTRTLKRFTFDKVNSDTFTAHRSINYIKNNLIFPLESCRGLTNQNDSLDLRYFLQSSATEIGMHTHLGENKQSKVMQEVVCGRKESFALYWNKYVTWSSEVSFSDDCETDKLSVWERKTK